MRDTSFGKLKQILEVDGKVKAEYLVFERAGRSHAHREHESFTVLSGCGQVECGENLYEVSPGDTVTISAQVMHRMIPAPGGVMTGLLWYHDHKGQNYLN